MTPRQECVRTRIYKNPKLLSPDSASNSSLGRLEDHSGPGVPPLAAYDDDDEKKKEDKEAPSEAVDTIDDLRRRMETALALQPNQHANTFHLDARTTSDSIALRRTTAERQGSSQDSLEGAAKSTGSVQTIKGTNFGTPSPFRTPSYPFPRMALHLPRGHSQLSGPRHKPFTLLSPTNAPGSGDVQLGPGQRHSSDPNTPIHRQQFQSESRTNDLPEDPNYPLPDLYDLVLLLNAEPGLEAWWANVTEILSEVYGAERASLAVPGDLTDLENIPWGQKASFNLLGVDKSDSSVMESIAASEHAEGRELDWLPTKLAEDGQSASNPKMQLRSDHKRPLLESRHSIACVTPDSMGRLSRQRPSGPVRAVSGRNEIAALEAHRAVQDSLPHPGAIPEEPATNAETLGKSSESGSQGRNAIVHRALHALEAEQDPLIVRTGITALFGKRRPIVMTRSFAGSSVAPGYLKARERSRADDTTSRQIRQRVGTQPNTALETRSKLLPSTSELPAGYEEFEQPEPNPWSKSPHPSPAARADPSESPFFNQSAHVDENTFCPEPSAYDYSVNQPLEAIGTDCSKTVIHIPLIQPVPSRRPLSSNLRFPTAIISLLTTITPYPLGLRHSLATLLPHLASSYSMAQQFSTLEAHTRGQLVSRYGRGLGLGGTFSDESSELELVAELSSQIARGAGEELRRSAHGSVRSPSERSTVSKGSPAETPLFESASTGFTPGLPPTPGRSGAEMVDSYFSSKRQKHVGPFQQLPRTPGAPAASTLRQAGGEESSARTKKQIPVSSQSLAKIKTQVSRKPGQSNPSSPRQDAASELLEGELLHLEPMSIEAQDHSNLRHHFGATYGATLPRDPGDRSLPDSVSQLLLNSVPLQLFLAKPKTGELIWTNSKFDAFRTQVQPQGVRTKDPWRNIHDADRQSLVRSWYQVLRTGAQMTQHIRVKRFSNDSDYRWFIFRANPLLAHTGQLIYWIGSFLDVHDQHVAEMKAAEERDALLRNAKYQALANSIPQILFEAVENIGIVSANEQWQTFSGQSLEEALNLGFTKHVHHDDLKKCGIVSAAQGHDDTAESASGSSECSEKTAMPRHSDPRSPADALSLTGLVQKGVVTIEQDENGRISYSTEIRLRSRGGEFRWFLVRLVKVESDLLNGGRASWYGTCTDINDRRALEKELNRVNQRMQQEMESKTKFFANMSHEIRTPLNGILGSIPWLVESSLEPDQRRTLDTIQNSSNNLRELVDNILDVTKVEAGKMTMAFKWFHIRTLLEEIIDTIASRAIDKGLQLNYTVDLNVPSTVKGDPFRLRQILINLMGNAVKFTDVGEVYTRCFVKERSEGQAVEPNTSYIAFEVVDTGRGFSKSEFQRLFKQFGQIVGSSSHDAGSGLGLFLSKQLVELHGGQLTAGSEVDQGSTFSFDIRVETRPADSTESPSEARPVHEMANLPETAMATSASGRNSRTSAASKSIFQSPGLSKYVASPEEQSPALASSGSSNPSVRSFSGHQTDRSSMSSLLPTPEHVKLPLAGSRSNSKTSERQALADRVMEASPAAKPSQGSDDGKISLKKSLSAIHPTTYSIVVICPAQYARAAIKQHIEQVVPHQIAVNVTTLNTVQEYLEMMDGATTTPVFTHVVLDLPVSHDLMLFMRQMLSLNTSVIPALVIITDHYQKREIADEYAGLTRAGRVAYMVHKPVKPSVFALIFDPAQQRNLSKDRNRDMAQSVTENFKNVADRVKSTLSGKSYRILLVEDSEVNRTVRVLTRSERHHPDNDDLGHSPIPEEG
jgi:signal transduction histidine kinase